MAHLANPCDGASDTNDMSKMARVDFSVRAHERRRMGPSLFRHLAHLACIAHAVLLAKTHMGRRARVATPARKKHLAIPITMTSIILTYGFAQILACRIAQCARK